jgi:hypothetical protein
LLAASKLVLSYAPEALSRSLVLPLLLLPGCLVSFNDYPLGDLDSSAGGSIQAGSSPILPSAGSHSQGNAGSGSAGDGGAPSSLPSKRENMIDDFEDTNPAILAQQGRMGSWYVGNDGMGTQTPRMDQPLVPSQLEPARADSRRGAHTFGGPFESWGALIGTELGPDDGYDLSGYQGMRLWVRSGAPFGGGARSVRLNLPTPGTNTGAGVCTVCSDHFGADIPLSSQWQQVTIAFSSLEQRGFGRPLLPQPDLAQVTSLQLSFGPNVTFDLWIDDIELY